MYVDTHVASHRLYMLLTVLTMLLALMPYRSSKASPGPLRGIRGTASICTVTPVSCATAAHTASPIPPSKRRNKAVFNRVFKTLVLSFYVLRLVTKLAPLSQPIKSESNINHGLFDTSLCFCLKFWVFLKEACVICYWLLW